MRSLWLLHELGIAFEVVKHGFDKSLRAPDYLLKSPAGRVPALELDGAAIFETGAITEVLCELFSPEVLGRPAGHAERAQWLIWVHFAETISQHAAALTQQHVALREDHMRSPIVMKLEAARILKCYAALDARLAGRDYLLDGGFSAADVSVGQAVYLAKFFAHIDGFAAVKSWYERITARAAFVASLPGDETLFAGTFFEPWEGAT
ncbi:Glutathione S-transferase [Sulfitobacter guttiformis KCTC 32187]|nr:Glutathione S-transferase [Sulfitobacter guttiformis KCTC 32187]